MGALGAHFCGHCNVHKEQRHVPYTLLKVQEAINFNKLADDHDLWPSTLHAINAGTLVRWGGLTEHCLQACTADAGFAEEEEAPEEEVEDTSTGIAGVNGLGGGIGPAGLLAPQRPKRGARRPRKIVKGVCKGPSIEALNKLTAWSNNHPVTCECEKCMVAHDGAPWHSGPCHPSARRRHQRVRMAPEALA